MSKTQRKFIREIERLSGVHVDATTNGSNHLRLRLPCGRFVIASGTPSDRNTIFNTLRDIRCTTNLTT